MTSPLLSAGDAAALAIHFAKSHWLAIVATLLVIRVIQTKWFHPLSKFSGPFWACITRWYSVYSFFTYRAEEVEYTLHEKYGTVVRYQPNMLLVSDPEMLRIVYNRQADKDPVFYGNGGLGMGVNVFTAMPAELHSRLRKRIAGAFSMTSIRPMERLIDARVQELQEKMSGFAKAGKTIDFALWAQFYTYDVLSELTFGRKFGFMEEERDKYNLVSGLLVGLPLVGLCGRIPFLNWLLTSRFVAEKVMPRPTDKDGIGAIMGHRDKLFNDRIKNGSPDGRQDLLHYILNSKNSDGSPITHEEVRDELLILMLAGSDTTSNIVRQCIYRFLQEPGVYEKLTAEIDAAYLAGKISKPVVTFDEAMALPYFTACTKEVLRLDPSAPSIYPRVAQKGGYVLNGKHVPEGTVVSTNAWVVNRNKEFYGKDANEYRPERWMESEEKSKVMENASFTFGYGPRICIGKNIAMMELHKVVFQFFLHFRPELVDLDKHGKRVNLGNFLQNGMWIKVHTRTPGA